MLKEILNEMIKSQAKGRCFSFREPRQEEMKIIIRDLTKAIEEMLVSGAAQDVHADTMCLLEICRKIEKVAPPDPIVKHGLEMMDFDKLLEKHQQDTEVSVGPQT